MIQAKEIGAYRSKQSVLDAKGGKEFITPDNRRYIFNYRKEGRKYIFILTYRDCKMQVSEFDYNTTPTDILLSAIDTELLTPIQ